MVSNLPKFDQAWMQCKSGWQRFVQTEFAWTSFGLGHQQPVVFTISQWKLIKPTFFLVYRAILAVGLLIWISLDIPREIHHFYDGRPHFWFLYATNWAFVLLAISMFILTIYGVLYNCPKKPNPTYKCYQPIWLLYNVASNSMLVVCLIFWVALSNSDLLLFTSSLSKLKHSLTAILVLIDLLISAIPIRLVHVVYSLGLGLIYAVFSLIFWSAGGMGPLKTGQIYPDVSWNHPGSTILICLYALLTCILVQIILYLVYFGRVCLSHRLGSNAVHPGLEDNMPEDYEQLPAMSERQKLASLDDMKSVTSMTIYDDNKSSDRYGAVE